MVGNSKSIVLYNAMCLTSGVPEAPPATVTVNGPLQPLNQGELIELTVTGHIDSGKAMAAFEPFGHPCASSIQFARDADGKIWAHGRRPQSDQSLSLVAAIFATAAAAQKRKNEHKNCTSI